MDIVSALTSVTKSIDVLKAMRELDKDFDAATYKGKIAELMAAVADAKIALIEAKDELASKDKEIEALKGGLRFRRENTIEVEGFRYEKGFEGKPVGMPFCTACDVSKGLLVRLQQTTSKEGYKAICPICKADHGLQHGYGYPR